jgi:hypothetical protein
VQDVSQWIGVILQHILPPIPRLLIEVLKVLANSFSYQHISRSFRIDLRIQPIISVNAVSAPLLSSYLNTDACFIPWNVLYLVVFLYWMDPVRFLCLKQGLTRIIPIYQTFFAIFSFRIWSATFPVIGISVPWNVL